MDNTLKRIITEIWRCPHCRHDCTILETKVCFVDGRPQGDFCCPKCLEEGITPLGEPDLEVIEGGASLPIDGRA